MKHGWYLQQAKQNPDLFRVVFDFNRRPQFWLHNEVVETLQQATVVKALSSASHGTAHLSAWLDKALGLDAWEPEWNFENSRRRLALLSPETLARLARFAGAALCWPAIVSVIAKAQIHEIKAALGEDAHAFALRRARLLIPESEALLPPPAKPLAAHAVEIGWNLVTSAAFDEAEPVQRRFSLKLPPTVAQRMAKTVASEARERAWSRVRKITTEVLTEGETKCFA